MYVWEIDRFKLFLHIEINTMHKILCTHNAVTEGLTNNGLETLIKIAQHQSFPMEMSNLLSKGSTNCNSKIVLLSPFSGEKKVLYV